MIRASAKLIKAKSKQWKQNEGKSVIWSSKFFVGFINQHSKRGEKIFCRSHLRISVEFVFQ